MLYAKSSYNGLQHELLLYSFLLKYFVYRLCLLTYLPICHVDEILLQIMSGSIIVYFDVDKQANASLDEVLEGLKVRILMINCGMFHI